MGPKKNPKAEAAEERQAIAQLEKDRKAKLEQESVEASAWSVGADARGASKQRELEDKAAAKALAKAQKDALLQAEEAEAASIGTKKAPKPKKKGKDDLDFLNEALANAPKSKAQKEAEAKKRADEERKRKEAADKLIRDEQRAADEEARRKAASRGIVLDSSQDIMIENTNRRQSDFEEVTGLDAALSVLSTKDDSNDNHPEKRQKALYNAYYERLLPIMKADYPGLKLSQYKDRIFEMWQKAPENPLRKGLQRDNRNNTDENA